MTVELFSRRTNSQLTHALRTNLRASRQVFRGVPRRTACVKVLQDAGSFALNRVGANPISSMSRQVHPKPSVNSHGRFFCASTRERHNERPRSTFARLNTRKIPDSVHTRTPFAAQNKEVFPMGT